MGATSALGAYIAVEGLLLNMGSGGSPETMTTIANVTDVSVPVKTNTIDVTNVGDLWKRTVPTLHDMGKITCKVFWIMEDPTHNSAAGLRYLMLNNIKRDFAFVYPDGNGSTDSFPAYVTGFAITAKVGGAFEASVELSNSGAPTLV